MTNAVEVYEMTKEDKEKILKILYGCIVNPEVDEEDQALVDYRQAKLIIMGIQEEPSFEIKHMEEKRERRMRTCSHSQKRRWNRH